MNTAACRSAITFIDGDKGILRYRGYPIEQLAEKSTFLETSYLLLHGELPTAAELDAWSSRSRTTRSFTRTSRSSSTAFTTTPTDGHVRERGGRPVNLLSRAKRIFESSRAAIRSCASSQKRPHWPPSHTGIPWGCRTRTPTTI